MTLDLEIAIMVRSLEPNFRHMTKTNKKTSAKTPVVRAQEGADKVTKKAEEVFGNLKKHFEPRKVDEWQKKWLAVPANRKKYEKLQDAPEVVGEELMAMANDIIDFAQGEETGKSNLFKKVRGIVGKATDRAKKGMAEARKRADSAKSVTKKVAKKAKK